jgi:hypothetical protein
MFKAPQSFLRQFESSESESESEEEMPPKQPVAVTPAAPRAKKQKVAPAPVAVAQVSHPAAPVASVPVAAVKEKKPKAPKRPKASKVGPNGEQLYYCKSCDKDKTLVTYRAVKDGQVKQTNIVKGKNAKTQLVGKCVDCGRTVTSYCKVKA